MYEKLDPNLVEQINDVDNHDVINFHRDNFLHFKDFKMHLKRDEMMSQLDNVKRRVTVEGKMQYQ